MKNAPENIESMQEFVDKKSNAKLGKHKLN